MGVSIGKLYQGCALFGKNSVRPVNEPQLLEFYPTSMSNELHCHTTYLVIDAPAETLGFVLSRPIWSWGGEIGVNEAGVAIGLEPIKTRGTHSHDGLTGMDLVRIGLERGTTAKETVFAILSALEQYGQGGNIGYTTKKYRDGAFLIMDLSEAYLLETAGKSWTYRAIEKAAVTEILSIGTDGEAYSQDVPVDFQKEHRLPASLPLSASSLRREFTASQLDRLDTMPDLLSLLSTHRPGLQNPMRRATNHGPCVHGGPLHGDGVTSSLAAALGERPVLWATGCGQPCLNLFKPWCFGTAFTPVFSSGDGRALDFWLQREQFHRIAIGKRVPKEFYVQKDALQKEWLDASEGMDKKQIAELGHMAIRQESEFFGRWRGALLTPRRGGKLFLHFWTERDKILSASHFQNTQ